MNNLKITIIGNSVALRTRPPREYPNQKNYGIILEQLLSDEIVKKVIVTNKAIGGTIISDVVKNIDCYVNTFADYYIINLGVVDASNREIPYWYFKIINSKLESGIRLVLKNLYLKIIKPVRPFLVKIRGYRSWTSERKFNKLFEKLIGYLAKETNSKIIILPINKTTDRIKNELPGSEKKYDQYNKIMENISTKYNQIFVKIDDLKPEIHNPDGIHYSKTGHELVAQKIAKKILEVNKLYDR